MAANGIKRKGGKLNPVFGGREVELDRLHAIVQRRGGYTAVTEERGWREVANVLDVSPFGEGVALGSQGAVLELSEAKIRGNLVAARAGVVDNYWPLPASTCARSFLPCLGSLAPRAVPLYPALDLHCWLAFLAAGRQVGQRCLLAAQAVREAAAPL